MNRTSTRFPGIASLLAVAALTVAGCGADDFSDEAFGVMDLGPFYDGGTPTNPAGGLPRQLDPLVGYVATEKVEHYDFGIVPVMRDPLTGLPTGAVVKPMYFFFDSAGNPMFSRPVREDRTGNDLLVGGVKAQNPNPKNFCEGYKSIPIAERDPAALPADACPEALQKLQDEQKKKIYTVRTRDLLVDPNRREFANDFQRPIVDFFPGDITSSRPFYTGLWEIMEVTAPAGYRPDSIKQWRTLEQALGEGGFTMRRTQKVINCPIIDERTAVVRGVADRPTYFPLVEVWYRRKLALCYLANGWKTLGFNTPPTVPGAPEDPNLYSAGKSPADDARRLDTFDVNRVQVGQGALASTQILVPVNRLYEPAVLVPNQDPMKVASRIRLVRNMISEGKPRNSEADPTGYSPIRWLWDFLVPSDYPPGRFKSVAEIDESMKRFRDTRELITQGARLVFRNISTRGVVVPCSFPPDEAYGKCEMFEQVPDPANPGQTKPKALKDPRCTDLQLECNRDTCSCDSPAVGYAKVCGFGIARCKEGPIGERLDDFSEFGYSCFPRSKGYCYIGCNINEPNRDQHKNGEGKPHLDSRCKSLPDYWCLSSSGVPPTNRFCLKFCDTRNDNPDAKQCVAEAQLLNEFGDALKPDVVDIAEGQECMSLGLDVCVWPEGYEPKF